MTNGERGTENGERKQTPYRFDCVPALGLRAAALVMGYGLEKRGFELAGEGDWREYRPGGHESGLNHALNHLTQAMETSGPERWWNLAKAATNLMIQVQVELAGGGGLKAFEEWFFKEKWPKALEAGARVRAKKGAICRAPAEEAAADQADGFGKALSIAED